MLLSDHFAFRAIPNNDQTCSSDSGVAMHDCAGWLFIPNESDSALKNFVGSFPNLTEKFKNGCKTWQETRFSRFQFDPLLYLGACRFRGFLVAKVLRRTCDLYAFETVSLLWRSNLTSPANQSELLYPPSSWLQMLLVVAVSNAAAKCRTELHMIRECSFVTFLHRLFNELGIFFPYEFKLERSAFANDTTLMRVSIPPFLFPGNKKCKRNRDFKLLEKIIGITELCEFEEGLNLLHIYPSLSNHNKSSVILSVMKKTKIQTGDIGKTAAKLMSGGQEVGVLVLENCLHYWSSAVHRNLLRKVLSVIENLGRAYIVSHSSEIVKININLRYPRRLIMIEVPLLNLKQPDIRINDILFSQS
jgi:hypothetical protein